MTALTPAAPGCYSLGRRQTPEAALVQYRSERLEPLTDRRFVNHADRICVSELRGNPCQQRSQKSIQLFAVSA
jgi:hypothetical protein